MKKMSVLVSISLLAVLLCGFCWPHNWIPATCTEPEICSKCGKTQADALGHAWENRKCVTCGMEKEILRSGDWNYILWEETGTAELTQYLGFDEDVLIPEQMNGIPVTAIGTLCFQNNHLETVNIPAGITAIGDFAFKDCTALVFVTIPDTIISIGKNPFLGSCPEFLVSVTNPTVAVIDGVLFDKTEKRLISYPCQAQREQYDIPQGILEIGDSAFLGARYLQRLTIPDSVTTVGRNPFCLCPAELAVSALHPTLAVVDGILFDKTNNILLAYCIR